MAYYTEHKLGIELDKKNTIINQKLFTMRKQIFTVLILIYSLTCLSQIDQINNIREHYKDVNQKISTCLESVEDEFYCDFYCNEIKLNTNNKSWRALGIFNKTIRFWYSDSPHFMPLIEKREQDALQKVEITELISDRESYTEILYKEGELIFYFYKDVSGFNEHIEERFYFSKGKLIRYLENQTDKTEEADVRHVDFVRSIANQMSLMFLQLHE